MPTKKQQTEPATLPLTGKSRFSQFKQFSPVSREKFRQLSKAGKAPKPERLGIRCTFYDNQELHRWLADPVNYSAGE
ncbi:MAG: transcriptional regulator [Nitrosomonas sp.]|nr:AlpA family transcriptional regulator [Nitrosomonas sp.]